MRESANSLSPMRRSSAQPPGAHRRKLSADVSLILHIATYRNEVAHYWLARLPVLAPAAEARRIPVG